RIMFLIFINLMFFWIHTSIAAVACPSPFSPVGEQCLLVLGGGSFGKDDRSWHKALDKCQQRGGTLAQLRDSTQLVKHIRSNDPSKRTWSFWVGAKRENENEEFRWTRSGRYVSNWDDGQPDNGGFFNFLAGGENCVELMVRNG
ncbi:unnamed protein product, partial [Meganyctiphanes norvegica]